MKERKDYTEKTGHDFNELRDIISILRSPEGCPWDRAQTHKSLEKCLTDECAEVIEAIEKDDHDNFCEELGDVLLQILLNCEIADEEGWFDFDDVVQKLAEKMIRRHPHVFADVKIEDTPEGTLRLWQQIKEREKEEKAKR